MTDGMFESCIVIDKFVKIVNEAGLWLNDQLSVLEWKKSFYFRPFWF